MRQRWWIVVVAAVGIGLAVLLFPRPDTGDDMTTGPALRTARVNPTSVGARDVPVEPTRMIPGPRPEAAEVLARRATPEAVTANLLVGPVSSFKYTMVKTIGRNAETPALEERVDALVTELRAVRIDPEERPWSEIEASVEGLFTDLSNSSYGSHPEIQRSITRARSLMAEYHEDPAAMAIPAGTPTAPISGTTPPEEQE